MNPFIANEYVNAYDLDYSNTLEYPMHRMETAFTDLWIDICRTQDWEFSLKRHANLIFSSFFQVTKSSWNESFQQNQRRQALKQTKPRAKWELHVLSQVKQRCIETYYSYKQNSAEVHECWITQFIGSSL